MSIIYVRANIKEVSTATEKYYLVLENGNWVKYNKIMKLNEIK
jgi:hypothetical protein